MNRGNRFKEQISSAYIRAISAKLGFVNYVYDYDEDSVDIGVTATGKYGKTFSPKVDLQLKCSSVKKPLADGTLRQSLNLKNYNDLRRTDDSSETNLGTPTYLVLCMVPDDLPLRIVENDEQLILNVKAYWRSLLFSPDLPKGSASTTVRIPSSQRFSSEILDQMMKGSYSWLANPGV